MGRERSTEYVAVALAQGRLRANSIPLRDVVANALGTRGRVLRAREGIVITLCQVAPGQDRRALAEGLRYQVATALRDRSLSAGVGELRASAAGAYLTALQAEQALLMGRVRDGEGRTTSFDELGPYSFILGQPKRDIRAYCRRVLGPLFSDGHDGDEETQALVTTLEVYIRLRNINEVARKLGIHRNTVRERLHRVAELTGANLKDADHRLALHMAILGDHALSRFAASSSDLVGLGGPLLANGERSKERARPTRPGPMAGLTATMARGGTLI